MLMLMHSRAPAGPHSTVDGALSNFARGALGKQAGWVHASGGCAIQAASVFQSLSPGVGHFKKTRGLSRVWGKNGDLVSIFFLLRAKPLLLPHPVLHQVMPITINIDFLGQLVRTSAHLHCIATKLLAEQGGRVCVAFRQHVSIHLKTTYSEP
eukprot:scaffold21341_cov19-Tisochrysis_lutea.AAC.1